MSRAMKPDFFIIGCGKCGTTSLAHLLGKHPDICISSIKEPNFLSYESRYVLGWDWYESLFRHGSTGSVRGEASVSYSMQEFEDKVAQRMIEHIPNARVIYIARNPFERIESVFREHHDSGHQHGWSLPFDLDSAIRYRPQMVTNSLYWQRTAKFRERLPADRILYLCLEDFRTNPREVLARCYELLGVDRAFVDTQSSSALNEGSEKFYDTRVLRLARRSSALKALARTLPQPLRGACCVVRFAATASHGAKNCAVNSLKH